MAGFSFLKIFLACAVLLCASRAEGAVRGSVRGAPVTYGARPATVYYPASTVYRPYYPPTVQTSTMTSAQCDNKWSTALLAEMLNYDNWKCSSRVMPDGTTQPCVITGPLTATTTTSTYYVNSGCGWILPFFCDDSVRDLVASMVGTQQAAAPPVPSGYTLIPGMGYFKVHPEALTWDQAKATCEAEGYNTHLATPSTASEYSALYAFLVAAIPTQNGAWLGFTDQAVEGDFRTVTNQPTCMLGEMPFLAGQPNGLTAENCIEFGYQATFQLNDFPCTTTFPFICEQTLSTRLAVCRTVVNG